MILIGGGMLDPNLEALMSAANEMGVPCVDMRVPPQSSPPFHWDLDTGDAGEPFNTLPRGAFVRQDVFAAMQDGRPEVAQRAAGWYVALSGWLMAHEGVTQFNRDMKAAALNKPAALMRARAAGLLTPATWVSNLTPALLARDRQKTIAKPVAGGGLCQTLEEAIEALIGRQQGAQASSSPPLAAMPALVQPRLASPEIRLFVIGEHAFSFEVRSPSLDYRALQDAAVIEQAALPPEVTALRGLMRDLGMDFGAADFKTDPTTGQLIFLELNTSPMFSHFDQVSGGRLCRAMVSTLAA